MVLDGTADISMRPDDRATAAFVFMVQQKMHKRRVWPMTCYTDKEIAREGKKYQKERNFTQVRKDPAMQRDSSKKRKKVIREKILL
jgi:hypothetical protein